MWLLESNREKHLIGGFILALTLTILATIGAALALEFKDKQYGNKFDWLDVVATLIGGILGQIVQLGIIFIIFYIFICNI